MDNGNPNKREIALECHSALLKATATHALRLTSWERVAHAEKLAKVAFEYAEEFYKEAYKDVQ